MRWADKRDRWNEPKGYGECLRRSFPVARLPAVVRNGEDADVCACFEIDDVIREAITAISAALVPGG
jgi:hypothetical protein